MEGSVSFEFPKRAVPGYLYPFLGDHYTRQDKLDVEIPPGHRFLIYFHALASVGEAEFDSKDQRKNLQRASADSDWKFFEHRLKQKKAKLTDPWAPLKSKKSKALKAAAGMGGAAEEVLKALAKRQEYLCGPQPWERVAELTAPLLTGSGNPHPVENGFAFLSPYGIPYLPGSGIKGVLRRAAEELALLDEESKSWNFFLVWVLFGFDATSALFLLQDPTKQTQNPFAEAYEKKLAAGLHQEDEALLDAWVSALDLDSPVETAKFLQSLQDKKTRERINWQGLLCFHDAFPELGAELGVDILNPHHWSYYQGDESPHDADKLSQLSFFLVLKPGARFTFRVTLLRRRNIEKLLAHIGNWHGLLDKAFEHACHWLGFGAKTAVGYGAMAPSPTGRADAGITKRDGEEGKSTDRPISAESGIVPSDLAPAEKKGSLGLAATQEEEWLDVSLSLDKGKQEVSCTFKGKRASSKKKDLLSGPLLQKLQKKGYAKARVLVKHVGGKEYEILEITEA